MTNITSLSTLVAIDQRVHGPRQADYLDYFRGLKSLADAIWFACHGKDGKIHSHQHLVGKEKLEWARKVLTPHVNDIKFCKSFDELLHLVEETTDSIHGFGVLAVYDTSLRLGAYPNVAGKVHVSSS